MITRPSAGRTIAVLALVGLIGAVVASFEPRRSSVPTRPLPAAPSVVAGGTARAGVSPGVLGPRLECADPSTCVVTWETARLPVRIYAGSTPSTIDRSTPVVVVEVGDTATVPVAAGGPTFVEVVADGDARGPVVGSRVLGADDLRDLGGYRTRAGLPLAWGRWFSVARRSTSSDTSGANGATLGLPGRCSGTAATAHRDPLRRSARRADARLLRTLTDSAPTWVRCGHDSGVWTVVLALTAAGVPRETVVGAVLSLAAAEGLAVGRDAVDRPLDRITARYGSFRRYLRTGLGLTPDEIAALRRSAVAPLSGPPG